MNLNQILNMFGRMVTRRLMNWGVNKDIDAATRRAGGTVKGKPALSTQKQAKAAREAVKRARQAARVTRRIGR
ncbi:MAG TPA: hypothetical protein PLL33_01905 [Paracoccus sp. (in: a-proteobacteria)]|nr:hypothetical protein [Paracoccus sp. (in: a-proteobacteria)]